MYRRLVIAVAIACQLLLAACQPSVRVVRTLEKLGFPVAEKSVRFAVIGDSGSGYDAQYEIGDWMRAYHEIFAFDFVIMLGDNLYGGLTAKDYEHKFEDPYKQLLSEKVEFYASLGNHDGSGETSYKPFNMGGERYYAFSKGNARFFSVDSNYLDSEQLRWLEKELKAKDADWKIVFMHHPIHCAGSYHGIDPERRLVLDPLFQRGGVNIVFTGHEHFYERLGPLNGIVYFTSGAAGKVHRRARTDPDASAAAYDADLHFMLVEIDGDDLAYRAISRTGKLVDTGVLSKAQLGESATPIPLSRASPASQAVIQRACG